MIKFAERVRCVYSEFSTNVPASSANMHSFKIFIRMCEGRLRLHIRNCRTRRKLIATSHRIAIHSSGRITCLCNIHMPMQMHANDVPMRANDCSEFGIYLLLFYSRSKEFGSCFFVFCPCRITLFRQVATSTYRTKVVRPRVSDCVFPLQRF